MQSYYYKFYEDVDDVYGLCEEWEPTPFILEISTLPNELDENDSNDSDSVLGNYLLEHNIFEVEESAFEVSKDFNEEEFIFDLKKLGVRMEKGNWDNF